MDTILQTNVRSAFEAGLLEPVAIHPSSFFYRVDFGELILPRCHYVLLVGEWSECNCTLGPDCPAVLYAHEQVEAILEQEKQGEEVVDRLALPLPHPTYEALRPARCPICGAPTGYDGRLSSPHRGEGWVCAQAGKSHYWQNRARLSAKHRNA
jgi:hypothetical protein